jgi:hypothetical protein
MGFFAKSKGAGLLDDRRNDVKFVKLIWNIISFPFKAIWWLIKQFI